MSIRIPAATCLAVIFAACFVGKTWAEEVPPLPVGNAGWVEGTGFDTHLVGGGTTVGPWTFAPVAEIRATRDALFNSPRDGGSQIASLGFRGAATVDSRFGAIYSRLSLSFDHALPTNDRRILTGLSGRGRNGYYASRSQIDVMMLDAAFALKFAPAVTGFADYAAEMDLGSGAEHQIALRLKFEF